MDARRVRDDLHSGAVMGDRIVREGEAGIPPHGQDERSVSAQAEAGGSAGEIPRRVRAADGVGGGDFLRSEAAC